MKRYGIGTGAVGLAVGAALVWFAVNQSTLRAQDQAAQLKVNPVMTQALADIEGRVVTVLRLELPPGHASQSHAHPAHAFVYVTKGSIVSQLAHGEVITYDAGEMWYEAPNTPHVKFENPSSTDAAEALVFYVAEEGQPLVVAPRGGHGL